GQQLGADRSLALDRDHAGRDLLDRLPVHGKARVGGDGEKQEPDQPTASRMLSNIRRPSSPPRTPSASRSGCGIIPSTLARGLVTPAMSASEPLGLLPRAPEGSQ